MNRREALQSALAAAVATHGDVDVFQPEKPLLAVLRTDQHITKELHERLKMHVRAALNDAGMPDVPCVILTGGMTLDIIEDPRT